MHGQYLVVDDLSREREGFSAGRVQSDILVDVTADLLCVRTADPSFVPSTPLRAGSRLRLRTARE